MRVRAIGLSLLLALVLLGSTVSPALGEGTDSYIVRPGDALEIIAQRFGTSVDDLVRLNGLPSADQIKAGQTLLIPQAGQPQLPAKGGDQSGVHVVAAGETLLSIANAYGVSADDLAAANQLADPDLLQVGQTLAIPTNHSGSPQVAAQSSSDPSYLQVPYRSQFDGTTYEESNCGPAALGMMMAYDNQVWSSDNLRSEVNRYTGDWSTDGGSTWESLAYAARQKGFTVLGLTAGKGYRRWTFDDLMNQVGNGHPPMLLVHYRSLPGHEDSSWWGDHYIVFLGVNANGLVVYHDPAFEGDGVGAYRTVSKAQLLRAWSSNAAGIQYSAMALQWSQGGN